MRSWSEFTQATTLGLAGLGLAVVAVASCGSTALTGEDGDFPPTIATVRLVSSKSVYATDEDVVVEVMIENASNVGSVPFRLRYDPVVLRFDPPAAEGPFMSADGTDTVFLASDPRREGEIVVGLSRLGAAEGAEGAGMLASFVFKALTAGNTGFAFQDATVKDPQAQNLPATFQAATVTVE